jgi:hypothetical protein
MTYLFILFVQLFKKSCYLLPEVGEHMVFVLNLQFFFQKNQRLHFKTHEVLVTFRPIQQFHITAAETTARFLRDLEPSVE